MTKLNIKGTRERVDAATEGPWMEMYIRAFQETPQSFDKKVWTVCGTGPVHHEDVGLTQAHNDAIFIRHARTDIPALLDALEKMAGVLKKVLAEWENDFESVAIEMGLSSVKIQDDELYKEASTVLKELGLA